MSNLTPKARALLERAARGHEPTDNDRARVRARVARKIALGTCVAGAASATSKTLTAGTGGLLTKTVVSIAIVGTVGAGATHWAASRPEPKACAVASAPPSHPAAAAAAVAKPVNRPAEVPEFPAVPDEPAVPDVRAEAAPVPPAPSSSVVMTRKRAAPAASAAPMAPDIEPVVAAPTERADPLAMIDEVDLLARAHEALARGDGSFALLLVQEHGRRFPKSAVAEERAAVRVFALCTSGRAAEAAREGAQFLEQHPRSPLAERVRTSCPASSGTWGAPPPHTPERGGNL
ncbi:hypothetical protein LVJ94_52810 [Pendulispora rubella]|uniref:Uncharacterized protein n=1 Tax=Pendulispora rubella TaxID=2741070 RepID=A0ABZ2L8R5_9BACT